MILDRILKHPKFQIGQLVEVHSNLDGKPHYDVIEKVELTSTWERKSQPEVAIMYRLRFFASWRREDQIKRVVEEHHK